VTDIVIRVTSSGLCGSDLHLYDVLGPFIDEADIPRHEPMGTVEAEGDATAKGTITATSITATEDATGG
jgi:threonine dehydrogenase-like Zn-dependent dehydrogenase